MSTNFNLVLLILPALAFSACSKEKDCGCQTTRTHALPKGQDTGILSFNAMLNKYVIEAPLGGAMSNIYHICNPRMIGDSIRSGQKVRFSGRWSALCENEKVNALMIYFHSNLVLTDLQPIK